MKPQKLSQPSKPQNQYREDEIKIYGVNACQTLFKTRPQAIIKVYLIKSKMNLFSDLIQFCVQNRKAYKIVEEQELEKLTESVHHEGICLLAKDLPDVSFDELLRDLKTNLKSCCLLYLDGVQNPHNVGNILRVCAHFGVRYVLVDEAHLKVLPASARRVSEGGSEIVKIVKVKSPEQSFKKLQEQGFLISSTSSHAATGLFDSQLKHRTLFILGSEVAGVAKKIEKLADQNVLIPGTNQVESLNVASACAILIGEYWRRFCK